MSTPKQKRLKEKDEPADNAPLFDVVLDEGFDDLETADAEFAKWRWPERVE